MFHLYDLFCWTGRGDELHISVCPPGGALRSECARAISQHWVPPDGSLGLSFCGDRRGSA